MPVRDYPAAGRAGGVAAWIHSAVASLYFANGSFSLPALINVTFLFFGDPGILVSQVFDHGDCDHGRSRANVLNSVKARTLAKIPTLNAIRVAGHSSHAARMAAPLLPFWPKR